MTTLTTRSPAGRPERVRSGAAIPWLGYLARRVGGGVAVLGFIVILTFLIVRLVPGDPARQIVGPDASPERVEQVREQLGLTEPLWRQFFGYVGDLVRGDLGASFATQQPVASMLAQRLPLTAELAGLALVVVLLVGVTLGVAAGVAQHRARARTFRFSFGVGASVVGAMPEYIAGALLVYVFAVTLGWLPVQGGPAPASIVLPVLAVAFAPTAVLARLVRNETASVLSQDYIMTAMSKRLSGSRLLLRHVLPNVVTSTLTLGGLLLVALLGGTVVTENVFNMAGVGSEAVRAIVGRDYPVVQGVVLTLGVLAVLVNLVVDVVLGLLDPRVLTRSAP